MKIVINSCVGEFRLSEAAIKRLIELGVDDHDLRSMTQGFDDAVANKWVVRRDPRLIQVIQELSSEEASSDYSDLQIVNVPDNLDWRIADFKGCERVEEAHRTWG